MATKQRRAYGLVAFALLAAAASVSFAASPVEDSNHLFSNFDRDQSSSISRAELGGFTNFARYDQNGDGELSQAEFVGGRNADRRTAAVGGRTEAAWRLLDWNNDGYLSGTELDGRWEAFDADRDGRVQQREFLADSTPQVPQPATPLVPEPRGDDPPIAAGKSLWGMKLAEARKADFFQFFQLTPLPGTVALEAGTRHDFRPHGPAFRNLVLVQVLVDDEERIKGVDVLVNRPFIDGAKTSPFARDLVKSVLRDFLPAGDRATMQTLIHEIEFGDPNRTSVAGETTPPLPNPPSVGYQSFLGIQEDYFRKLGTVQLRLTNLAGDDGGDLRISIQVKTDDEEKT